MLIVVSIFFVFVKKFNNKSTFFLVFFEEGHSPFGHLSKSTINIGEDMLSMSQFDSNNSKLLKLKMSMNVSSANVELDEDFDRKFHINFLIK